MSKVQIIEKDGRPEWAVVPYDEWERLNESAEDAADVTAYDQAKAETEGQETIPSEVVGRLLAHENPVKVWREHRGLKQIDLAQTIGISRSYLSLIEAEKKEGTVSLYRRLAQILDVSVDELIGSSE